MNLSRREWIALATGAFAALPASAAKEFWETREPDDWTSEEIHKLLTKSPWAREVSGERTARKKEPGFPAPRTTATGRSRVTIPNGTQPTRVTASVKGTLVWESAKPIRLATKEALGAEFEGMYVLSLAGVPIGTSKAALDRVRQASTLRLKGHDPLEAALVRHVMQAHDVFLFGFARQGLAITREEKEVVFSTTVNRISLLGKFNPRDMLFRGELAL